MIPSIPKPSKGLQSVLLAQKTKYDKKRQKEGNRHQKASGLGQGHQGGQKSAPSQSQSTLPFWPSGFLQLDTQTADQTRQAPTSSADSIEVEDGFSFGGDELNDWVQFDDGDEASLAIPSTQGTGGPTSAQNGEDDLDAYQEAVFTLFDLRCERVTPNIWTVEGWKKGEPEI
ncbi:hypothetical protein A4X13_0g7350 [Tilletia indica]|uniref:Uncharacterized protein n=1 Tax=Tilletia indica TaxID=43049 RepID=A0A8T8SK04_9BASI|nr:hypothetical protein A4X13_0g7350 [Tilletia indica]